VQLLQRGEERREPRGEAEQPSEDRVDDRDEDRAGDVVDVRKMEDAGVAANVRAMIGLAKAKGIPVVLLATPKPGFPPSVPAFYGEIARSEGVAFEEAAMRDVLFHSSLKSDLVHPNAEGYARIAAAIETLLRKSGAL